MKTMIKLFLMALPLFATAARADSDLPTVEHVDIPRYLGRWYEIAALPQWFERNCFAARADYTLREDGKVNVINSCRKGSLDGRPNTARGVARIVDTNSNAKLKVQFFWPFEGDYWILDLADDYSYVLVGAPSRESLWVLARQPSLSPETLEALLDKASELGFPVADVRLMPQND